MASAGHETGSIEEVLELYEMACTTLDPMIVRASTIFQVWWVRRRPLWSASMQRLCVTRSLDSSRSTNIVGKRTPPYPIYPGRVPVRRFRQG
jgi:hypothetical protein